MPPQYIFKGDSVMGKHVFEQFDNGVLACADKETNLESCAWNAHKDFAGVSIKNLVAKDQTAGLLACCLVRIAPDHALGLHAHPDSMELHEVIAGNGTCAINQRRTRYAPGVVGVIACNEPHEVRAGKEGLLLFAKFVTVPV